MALGSINLKCITTEQAETVAVKVNNLIEVLWKAAGVCNWFTLPVLVDGFPGNFLRGTTVVS